MRPLDRLQVRVNDELELDAGACEEVTGIHGREFLVHPPETTLFHQVLAYLRSKPDPPGRPYGSMVGREGGAAAALVLRWGSYLAVLLDRNKPVWPQTRSTGTSRISDEEMARINIEASAALAEWIDIFRGDPGGPEYMRLVDRAVSYLPMPRKTSKPETTELAALADPDLATQLANAVDFARLDRIRADAEHHPSRVLANAIINTAWRNGPVEDVHAGSFHGYPLDQRRVTPSEEREQMRHATDRLALGMTVCTQLAMERRQRTWPEQVLPFGLAEFWLITPSRWTLTEASREVHLPAE